MSVASKLKYKNSKLILLAIILIGTTFLWSGCAESKSQATDDVPVLYRGNPERTGVFDSKEAPLPNSIRWKYKAPTEIYSTPVIANGVAFFGCSDWKFYAVDVSNGQKIWEFSAKSSIASSAAVYNGTVYFGSWDGNLYALDAESGEEKWSFETTHAEKPLPELNADRGILSSPVVSDGIIYFGSITGYLYALDAQTGQELWELKTDGLINASPAMSQKTIFLTAGSNLYSVDAKEGTENWKVNTGVQTSAFSSPVVSGDNVILDDASREILAFDPITGKQKWSLQIDKEGSGLDPTVAARDGNVFFGDVDGFYAVDAKTGQKKWEYKPGKDKGAGTVPSIAGDSVYFADFQGNIVELSIIDGNVKKKYKYQNNIMAMPSSLFICDGVIYLGSADGFLYAISGGSQS